MEPTLGQADWRKSSYSGGTGNCVEVAGNLPGIVAVRDSQDPGGPALIVTPAAWRALTRKVRSGGLNLAAIPVRPSKNPREKANPGAAGGFAGIDARALGREPVHGREPAAAEILPGHQPQPAPARHAGVISQESLPCGRLRRTRSTRSTALPRGRRDASR
jgi:hypothetical protein